VRFEAKIRDGNTRLGELEIKGKTIIIPAILWYSSPRIPAPSFAEVKLGEDIGGGGTFFYPEECEVCIPPALIYPHSFPEEIHERSFALSKGFFTNISIVSARWQVKKADMYVMAQAREVFSNPRIFVDSVVNIRNNIGYAPLYAPGIATPLNMAILSYAGIDIFDSIAVVQKTRKNRYLTPEGEYDASTMEEYPCRCPYCREGIHDYHDLLMHNYEVMRSELVAIRQAIRKRMLREYAEAKAHFNPHFASIFRIFDRKYYSFQEKRYPVTGNTVRVSCWSLERPDIRRFRERVISRYRKPACAKVLLLLPCSARKPYSRSKSHQRFKRIIASCPQRNIIHEVIVTSPLGLVPRELENIYPAAHYDISVTGEWSKEEVEMIDHLLHDYLAVNHYEMIINHLPSALPLSLEGEVIHTCREHPTSDASLEMLEKAVKRAEDIEAVRHTQRRRDNVRAMLQYQFGEAAELLLDGCAVKGKFPDYKLYQQGRQLACFSQKRGMFSLTLPGGEKLGRYYWVEIDDFIPKGSIFAVGVKDADEKIRSGDEVVVFHQGEVRGVGVARMNAEEMRESKTGEAVKIRHHL